LEEGAQSKRGQHLKILPRETREKAAAKQEGMV
jgi:hypothetical protein